MKELFGRAGRGSPKSKDRNVRVTGGGGFVGL